MANVVYNYPKSSCRCYKCKKIFLMDLVRDVPTNLSFKNCDTPKMFECYNQKPFSVDIQPKSDYGYINLNPTAMSNAYSKDFYRIECPNNACSEVQYTNKDPRLISVAHGGQMLTLDRPPTDKTPKLSDISTDTDLNGYGQKYRTYSDIKGGNIIYYIDKSIQDPFFSPLFSAPARVYGTIYRDPMGSIKPQYYRDSLERDPINNNKDSYDCGLSWMRDSQEHRQDLLARQMYKRNQEKWESRWK